MDDEVRYPAVYDALREFSQVAIGRFQEEIGEEAIPQQTRWQVADKPDGTSEQYQVYEPDYFKLVSSQKDVLAEIPGYEECVEALLSNELYREHLPRVTDDEGDEVEDPDYEDWVRIETLVRLLAYYLEEKDALAFDEEVFKRGACLDGRV